MKLKQLRCSVTSPLLVLSRLAATRNMKLLLSPSLTHSSLTLDSKNPVKQTFSFLFLIGNIYIFNNILKREYYRKNNKNENECMPKLIRTSTLKKIYMSECVSTKIKVANSLPTDLIQYPLPEDKIISLKVAFSCTIPAVSYPK